MNLVTLIGRLTKNPELAYTVSQTALCKFTIAVDRPKRQGENNGADFIRITVFGKQAETCDRYLEKGRQVAIHGHIQTGSFDNKYGEKVYTTDVVADRVEFLGGNPNHNGQQNSRPRENTEDYGSFDDVPFSPVEDDLPFDV